MNSKQNAVIRKRPRRIHPFVVLASLVSVVGCIEVTSPYGRSVVWSATQFGGTTATPYVDETIAVSGVAFTNQLFAVDRRSGRLLWEVSLELPPNAFGDRVISPSMEVLRFEDNLIVASNWLHALDRTSGEVVWSFMPADWPGRQVVLAGDRLIGTGTFVYSIEPRTGEVLWRTDLGELPSRLTYEEGVLYFGAQGVLESEVSPQPLGAGHVMAVDAESGSVLWKHMIPNHPTAPWVGGVVGRGALTANLFIVAARNARVYALDRWTGELRWMHEGESPYLVDAVVVEDVVVVGGSNGDVEGLDVETGELRWVLPLGSSIGEIGWSDGVALPANGRIWAVDHHGQVVWGFGGAGWGQPTFQRIPVVRAGVLYANSVQQGLFAVRVPF